MIGYGSSQHGRVRQKLCEWIRYRYDVKEKLPDEQARQFDIAAVLMEVLNDSLSPVGPVAISSKLVEVINLFHDQATLLQQQIRRCGP